MIIKIKENKNFRIIMNKEELKSIAEGFNKCNTPEYQYDIQEIENFKEDNFVIDEEDEDMLFYESDFYDIIRMFYDENSGKSQEIKLLK